MRADNKEIQRLLNIAKGQFSGIQKMIDEDRYCLDISAQLLSTIAILKKINNEVIKAHLNECVKEAIVQGNGEEKVDEIIDILDKVSK